jgi:hypothetical protein
MTDLKTLKYMGMNLRALSALVSSRVNEGDVQVYSEKELRRVAKEWIKELESNNAYYSVGLNNSNLINWIKHFFNLGE